jgi:hypothetical protein
MLSRFEIFLSIGSISIGHDAIANVFLDIEAQLTPLISKRGTLLFLASRYLLSKRVFRGFDFL